MDCKIYDEMMTRQLDGMLNIEEEAALLSHIAGCAACRPLWTSLQMVDALLVSEAARPVPIPAGFTMKVMQTVAVSPVARPALAASPQPAAATAMPSVLPPQFAGGEHTLVIPEVPWEEWQNRIASYVRGAAAAGVAIAATFGVLLALLMSGSIQLDSSVAPSVEMLRTFFESLGTWARSLASGVGAQFLVVSGTVLGLLALAGWQIVTAYHQAARAVPETAAAEMAA